MLHVPGTSEVIDFIGPKIKSDVSICPMLPVYLCVLRAVT